MTTTFEKAEVTKTIVVDCWLRISGNNSLVLVASHSVNPVVAGFMADLVENLFTYY